MKTLLLVRVRASVISLLFERARVGALLTPDDGRSLVCRVDAPYNHLNSSDDESTQCKLDKKLLPFRIQNNGHAKRRRSSMASFAIAQDELAGPSEQRVSHKTRSSRDRFVANSAERTIPMCATPRSRRLAKAIGEAGDKRLYFHSQENVNPANEPRNIVPFRKEQQRLIRSLYEIPAPPSATSASTNLCAQPETCLGAPGLDDDFYSRLAAWSSRDLLAVAMNSSVVFRNMRTQTIGRVVHIGTNESVTCVGWNPNSAVLAVGNDWGFVRIYEPELHTLMREFSPHREKDFVGDFCWKDTNVVTVGYQTGHLRQFDMREQKGGRTIRSHRARICGVEWNSDGRFLATGGGDGVVVCWDARANKSAPLATFGLEPPLFSSPDPSPSLDSSPRSSSANDSSSNTDLGSLGCRWRARRHLSTVKALAWCPWSPDLLATGGGTKDGAIRFWDAARGRPKKLVINTYSQVTSLHFAQSCREIVSTHGYAFAPAIGAVLPAPRKQSVLVHSYPKGELTGKVFDAPHGRITHSCLNPDGTRLVTCGSDDSIRIYKVFGKQEIDLRSEDMFSRTIIR
ncbi:hypothetical protein M0805_006196 [Coniferiporia weirii]|nr:hypothetical protein M0805_006196 [Coniferiporia weirii]